MADAPTPPRLRSFRGSLLPFRALRFTPESVADLDADLIVPPRMSAHHPEDAAEGGPPTVQRLFPHPERFRSGAWDPRDRSQIGDRYALWTERGHLTWDPTFGMYLHRVSFKDETAATAQRLGLYAVLAIRDDGQVRLLPHEQTLPERVKRQVDIFTWRGALVLPLFILYSDPQGELMSLLAARTTAAPTMAYADTHGQQNALWQLTDPDLTTEIQRWFDGRELLLADGHHRLDAALDYWRELRGQHEEDTPGLRAEDRGAESYVVVYLTPAEAPGLKMGTFHRGLRLDRSSDEALSYRLGPDYEVHHLPLSRASDVTHAIEAELAQQRALRAAEGLTRPRFVVMSRGEEGLYLVHRREPLPTTTPATDRLDATELHRCLIPRLSGVTQVEFQQDTRTLVESIRAGRLDLGCFLNPPSPEEVWAVARSGIPMPPKATYYYPKLPAGLFHFPLGRLIYQAPT